MSLTFILISRLRNVVLKDFFDSGSYLQLFRRSIIRLLMEQPLSLLSSESFLFVAVASLKLKAILLPSNQVKNSKCTQPHPALESQVLCSEYLCLQTLKICTLNQAQWHTPLIYGGRAGGAEAGGPLTQRPTEKPCQKSTPKPSLPTKCNPRSWEAEAERMA